MKTLLINFLLISALILAGCSSATKREQTITISGAFALYPLTVKWAEEYRKEHPEVRFNITGGGAGKGMADALGGTVDLGMFSRTITEAELNQGIWWVALTIDAVLPVMNVGNPAFTRIRERGLTRGEFTGIFLSGNAGNWEQFSGMSGNKPITVYTRADACGAAETWAKYLSGAQEDIKGIGIYGDPGLAEAVAKDPVGIGFNNAIYIYDMKTGALQPGLAVPPIDLNENGKVDPEEDFYGSHMYVLEAIARGVYPSPPARDLYFVSHGKPVKPAALDFIRWTLTEGQQFIEEAGYVWLDSMKLVGERMKME
jgi:phosphate transport system substrate-binding protein